MADDGMKASKAEKIKVRFQKDSEILVHNDLSNAAYYFETRVGERLEKDDREGIAFDIIAGLIMVAFTFEAQLNFLGWKLIPEWTKRERSLSFRDRTEAVRGALRLETDWGKSPSSP